MNDHRRGGRFREQDIGGKPKLIEPYHVGTSAQFIVTADDVFDFFIENGGLTGIGIAVVFLLCAGIGIGLLMPR